MHVERMATFVRSIALTEASVITLQALAAASTVSTEWTVPALTQELHTQTGKSKLLPLSLDRHACHQALGTLVHIDDQINSA